MSQPDYLQKFTASTPRSKAMHEQAAKLMPGGISHNQRFHAPYPLYFKSSSGCTVTDVDGNTYRDLWMAHYDAILGHAPQEVVSRLKEVMDEGLHIGLGLELEVQMAERVVNMVPSAEQVRFGISGTEATMYAVRLARAFTKRNKVIKMVGGWHGANSDLLVDVFGPEFIGPEGAGLLPELANYTKAVQYNNIEDAHRVMNEMGDDLAAVILEPVMGSLGFVAAEPEFLAFLREETRKRGALLIFDEVITGFRMAPGGAQERFNVMPDLTTMGKVMGGGMPIGALAGREDILSLSAATRQVPKKEKVVIGGGTYSANPLTMVAGMVTLDILNSRKDTIYPQIEGAAQRLGEGVQKAFDDAGMPAQVNTTGSLHGVLFPKEKGTRIRSAADAYTLAIPEKRIEMAARLRNHGVFVFHSGAISTVHGPDDIDFMISAYRKVAQEMAG